MKNIFEILSPDFFKPLTSKCKTEYADCILLLFNSLKPEISYGVNREIVVKVLSEYFELDEEEMTFDDINYIQDARGKANGVISTLRTCGWLTYEQETNHEITVVLNEYAIPVIESLNKIVRDDEAEYQGIISQIHASLQNPDLYGKPYELVIKGVKENTERLISELKKLNASIKRHMEVEQCEAPDEAYDNVVTILQDVKSAFYRLDEIIEEIDRKHTKYMRNAVMRARFKLATGNNLEGKLSKILEGLAVEMNRGEAQDISNEVSTELKSLFSLFPQNSLSPESLKTIPVTEKNSVVDKVSTESHMSEEQRQLYKEALRMKNRNRFSRKNINEFVVQLLGERKKMSVEEIPVESRRDLIRIIYISIYAGNRSNNYSVKRSDKRVKIEGFEFPYFEIMKKD